MKNHLEKALQPGNILFYIVFLLFAAGGLWFSVPYGLIGIALCVILRAASLRIENERRQRLQDIGMTTSEFDMMLQQKRSDSALKQTNKRKRPKRHKSFLDEKNFRDHE